MTIWFTSDQHFGHRNIIRYSNRPFESIGHMHEELIRRFNERVAAEDTVYHVGDFALDDRLVKQILFALNGRHILVAGNHDKCHPCHSRWAREVVKYLDYGFSVAPNCTYVDDFLVCHLPYVGDSGDEPRYPQFRPRDAGRWLLHGHVHEAWKVRDRMINVGVDQWDYAPVSLETLQAIRAGT